MESGEWSVECGVWSVECGVWRVESGVWSVECGVWSVECGVWSVECGVWSVECGVEWSRVGEGQTVKAKQYISPNITKYQVVGTVKDVLRDTAGSWYFPRGHLEEKSRVEKSSRVEQ